MSKNNLYHNFYQKWREVTELPTQTVGPLTPLYKKTVPFFKTAPWRILAPLAFLLVCIGALLLELTAVQVASVLQKGF